MNITLQIWNGPKYSILLRQDFQLADLINAVHRTDIKIEDYIFVACGKKINLEDEVEFNQQKRLFFNTYVVLSPKKIDPGSYTSTADRC
jgi:hypothetical protein